MTMVGGLNMDDELTVASMKKTEDELKGERAAVEHLMWFLIYLNNKTIKFYFILQDIINDILIQFEDIDF